METRNANVEGCREITIRDLIKTSLRMRPDLIIHLGRLRDRSRKVLEIVEVLGFAGEEIQLKTLYRFEEEGEDENGRILGTLQKRGELTYVEKLKAAGLYAEGG